MLNPIQHLQSFLQCLSENKRPFGFLLGAGCPFSIKINNPPNPLHPLIPAIEGLTRYVYEHLPELSDEKKAYDKAVSQIMSCCTINPTIEQILSHIRMLKSVAIYGALSEFSAKEIDQLELFICNTINECVNIRLPENTPYHDLADWISSTTRDKSVEIFTTNYDLLMEEALEKLSVPFFDGFSGSYRPFFNPHSLEHDIIPPRWAKVWKLHGSINWRCVEVDGGKRFCRSFEHDLGTLTIHPSHLKYDESRKMPYLAMIDRLKNFITTPESVLFILGYSFGDAHLNETILNALESSAKSSVFAIMFNDMSQQDVLNATIHASNRSNLSIFAKNGAVIGTKKYSWEGLPKVDDTNLPPGILTWSQSGPDMNIGDYRLHIGNFVVFGKMLRSITGRS